MDYAGYMESHAIPQQISSYQFRLVGDMTLKQFFQIAGGALVSLLFYSLPIIGIIKWPFVIFFALLGVALAFLPLEERPLERWIIAFFRAVYSPTIFFWKKAEAPSRFFQEETVAPQEKIATPVEEKLGKFERNELSFLSGLTNLFNNLLPGTKAPSQPTVPSLTTSPQPIGPIEMTIPVSQPVAIPPKLVVEETSVEGVVKQAIPVSPVTPSFTPTGMVASQQAQFSIDAAPPSPPTTANTIVGQVIDQDRKIVEAAILEIRDEAGRPVRALKSNKLGHFIVVTPLQSGKYEIITEKDGFEFEPVAFGAEGGIIPPIAISGKRLAEPAGSIPPVVKPAYQTVPVKGSYPW